MYRKRHGVVIASMLAAAMTASAAFAAFTPLTASANQMLGESTFDYKMLPWHTVSYAPARQELYLEDGAAHIRIISASGAEKENWDLQFRYGKLNFQKGHTYKVSFYAKSNRDGLRLMSHIGDTGEPYDQYCTLQPQGFVQGPHMGGGGQGWGQPVELTTEWQNWEGTFQCTEDLKGKQWVFFYANSSGYTSGNAMDGDEIWFDNMSIECLDCDEGWIGDPFYSTGRDCSNLEGNYISVNQIGYFTNGPKTATLGDNQGDILYHAMRTELKKDSYTFELVDTSGKVVYTGTTGTKFYDEDSHDNVCKIDFSDFNKPGTYYLRIKDQNWRSFEFTIADNPYTSDTHDLLTNSLNYFYQSRSGCSIDQRYITSGDSKVLAHRSSHNPDTAHVQKKWIYEYLSKGEASVDYSSSRIEATGGWFNAADHGKYMIEGGMTVWTLQNLYERAAQKQSGQQKFADGSGVCVVPETGNEIPDILDECKYELDFMETMKVDESEPTWGKYAGLYYHQVQDHKWTGLAVRPWNYIDEWETVRIVKPPTFAATLNYAACAAQAARLWEEYDADYAAELLQNAKDAYDAFMHQYYEADYSSTTHPILKNECVKEELDPVSKYAPEYLNTGGSSYSDFEVGDDQYWAACELYITAKQMEDPAAADYLKDIEKSEDWYGYKNAFKVPETIMGGENDGREGSYTVFNWGNTGAAGSLSLALHQDLLTDTQKETLNESLLSTAQKYVELGEKQGYGIPYQKPQHNYYDDPIGLPPDLIPPDGYEYGSNARAISNMIAMAYAYDLTGESKYINGVVNGMNYLFGNNPLSFSYVTGYGSYYVKNPEHRYWAFSLDDTLPMTADGVLVGGSTVYIYDSYMRALGFNPYYKDNPSQRCYSDDIEASSCNCVYLSWNAELAWIVSFLQDAEITKQAPCDTTMAQTETTAAEPQISPWGDATCDGSTDVADAVLLAKYLVADPTGNISEQGKLNANIVKGDLDTDDLSAILMFIAKKITAEQLPLDKLPTAKG